MSKLKVGDRVKVKKIKPKTTLRKLYAIIPTYGVSSVTAWFDKNVAIANANPDDHIVEFIEVKK